MDQLFPAGDSGKVAIFVVAIVAFFAVARWISRRTESSFPYQGEPQAEPLPVRPGGSFERAASDSEKRAQKVILDDIWFDTFDVEAGPPDPKRFCSEMTVTIKIPGYYDRNWTATFPVATPEGMRDKLQKEGWKSMLMPELIVVDRYDIKEICETVIDYILSQDPDTMIPTIEDMG